MGIKKSQNIRLKKGSKKCNGEIKRQRQRQREEKNWRKSKCKCVLIGTRWK